MIGVNNLKTNNMADITMCTGEDCPLKESCYRFTANASEHWQSYFTEPPIIKGEEVTCEYYWEIKKKEK